MPSALNQKLLSLRNFLEKCLQGFVRERDRDTKRDRDTERDLKRDRDRERDRENWTLRKTVGATERQREIEGKKHTQTDGEATIGGQ